MPAVVNASHKRRPRTGQDGIRDGDCQPTDSRGRVRKVVGLVDGAHTAGPWDGSSPRAVFQTCAKHTFRAKTTEGQLRLIKAIMPGMKRRVHGLLAQFGAKTIDEATFAARTEAMLQGEHAELVRRGIGAWRAAVAIHSAVLLISRPGLRTEAKESGVPLEVLEARAVNEAAGEISKSFGLQPEAAASAIATAIAKNEYLMS